MNEVLLFTCGIDSYIAREYLIQQGRRFDCLYFNHGGKYCKVEMEYIDRLTFNVKLCSNVILKDIEQESAFIPNRNILLSIMANSMNYDTIWIGGSKSDRVNDNNEKVFNQLSEFLSTMNQTNIRIMSPFFECYKEDMIRWFIINKNSSKEARIELLDRTFSCFNPLIDYQSQHVSINERSHEHITRECQNCSACFRKSAVLYSCGINRDFYNPEIVYKYEKEFKNPLIDTPRSLTTMQYIHWWKNRKCRI